MLRSDESSVRARGPWAASLLAVLLVLGYAGFSEHAAAASSAVTGPATSVAVSTASAIANGEAIFRTGRDLHGAKISANPQPQMQFCAACHRANGSGGLHFSGGVVSADLRYRALVTEQKPPYTVPLLERAIATGMDNTGHRLSPVMPRWQMSKRDLHDVAQYVLTKLK